MRIAPEMTSPDSPRPLVRDHIQGLACVGQRRQSNPDAATPSATKRCRARGCGGVGGGGGWAGGGQQPLATHKARPGGANGELWRGSSLQVVTGAGPSPLGQTTNIGSPIVVWAHLLGWVGRRQPDRRALGTTIGSGFGFVVGTWGNLGLRDRSRYGSGGGSPMGVCHAGQHPNRRSNPSAPKPRQTPGMRKTQCRMRAGARGGGRRGRGCTNGERRGGGGASPKGSTDARRNADECLGQTAGKRILSSPDPDRPNPAAGWADRRWVRSEAPHSVHMYVVSTWGGGGGRSPP